MKTHEVLAIRHVGFEDLGILAPVLQQQGFQIRYWDAGIDSLADLAAATPELVVCLGGPIGANEDHNYPWLPAEREFLRTQLERQVPVLGICLGAQLLALLLGGKVEAQSAAEIGWAPLTITTDGHNSLLADLESLPVLHWHGDRFLIPEGVDVLASTPLCPQQAFGWPAHTQVNSTEATNDAATSPYLALGLQFHIEAQSDHIERWCIGHAHELATRQVDLQQIRADSAHWGPQLQPVAQQILSIWLDQLTAAGYLPAR